MTAMANTNAGAQPQQLMYYYVAVPGPGGSGPQYGVQGPEGMGGGQFDGTQQVPPWGIPQQGGCGYGDQAVPMAMQPALMPGGQVGPMMLVMNGQMMGAQQQQAPAMDGGQGPQEAQGAPGACGWGAPMQPPQGGHEPPGSQSAGTRTSGTSGSKAFKITNPFTNEEIKGVGHAGQGYPGNMQGWRTDMGTGSDGRGMDGQPPPGQVPGGQSQPPQGPGMVAAPQGWPQQPAPQQSSSAALPYVAPAHMAGVPGAQPMQSGGPTQQMQPPMVQTQPHPSPAVPMVQPQPSGGAAAQSASAAGAAAAAAAAPKQRKGLINKKIEKPGLTTSGANASADGAPAAGTSGAAPAGEVADQSGDGGAKAAAVTTPAAQARSPEPAATKPSPSTTGGGGGTPAQPTASPSTSGGGTSGGGGGGGGTGGGGASTMQLPRWPAGGPATNFPSSIKALNLEPMRANPQPRARAQVPRPGTTGDTANTGSAEATPAASQPSPQPQTQPAPAQQQPAPSPQQPQHTPAPSVPQPHLSPMPPQQHLQPAPQQQQQVPVQQMQQAQAMQQQMQPQMHPAMQMQQPHMMPQMQMAMQQMPHGMMGQMVMPVQAMHQVPVAPAGPAPAGPAPLKTKGVKLKNAVLKRPGQKEDEPQSKREDGDGAGGDEVAPSPSAPASMPKQEVSRAAVPGISLRPASAVFDRTLMLRIWRASRGDVHKDVEGLHVNARPGEKGSQLPPQSTPVDKRRGPKDGGRHELPERPNVFGTDKTGKGKKPDGLKPGENAYKVQQPTKREDELERRVRSLLNKICPDNLKTIVERLALIQLDKAEELEFVIRIIFGKALAEPHYCETYADMVFALRTRYPEFPAESEGEKPQTFTRVLLNTCQNEFESLPTTFEPSEEERNKMSPDDLRIEMKKRKDKMLANMKFIGNLFLRQLLAVKVIGQVVHELIGIKENLPEEHMIECVCELLQAIGHTLDGTTHGKMLMCQFQARLMELKKTVNADNNLAYCRRIQFQIQDLLDLRANSWQKKLFKEQAKTKEEVRKDMQTEARKQAKGAGPEVMFATQTAGMRPSYIDDFKTPKPARQRVEGPVKPNWDQGYVKRVFTYYVEARRHLDEQRRGGGGAEDHSGEDLVAKWNEAQPTTKEAKQGLEWLLEIGFNDKQREEVMADCITELVQRRVVTWELLRDALSGYLEGLEDMRIDVPNCEQFFMTLLARLLQHCGRDFNPMVVKPLPIPSEGSEFAWKLFAGALWKLKTHAGSDAVRKALEIRDFSDTVCKARKCTPAELKRYLQDDGVL